MTRREIAKQISERTGIHHQVAYQVIDEFCNVVKEQVSQGERVLISDFGVFDVVLRRRKKARNIKAGTIIEIPMHYAPVFRPNKEFLVELANNLPAVEK